MSGATQKLPRLGSFEPNLDTAAVAERWVAAVNAEGSYGKWVFRMVKGTTEVSGVLSGTAQPAEATKGG